MLKGFGVVHRRVRIPDFGRFWLALLCAPQGGARQNLPHRSRELYGFTTDGF